MKGVKRKPGRTNGRGLVRRTDSSSVERGPDRWCGRAFRFAPFIPDIKDKYIFYISSSTVRDRRSLTGFREPDR